MVVQCGSRQCTPSPVKTVHYSFSALTPLVGSDLWHPLHKKLTSTPLIIRFTWKMAIKMVYVYCIFWKCTSYH